MAPSAQFRVLCCSGQTVDPLIAPTSSIPFQQRRRAPVVERPSARPLLPAIAVEPAQQTNACQGSSTSPPHPGYAVAPARPDLPAAVVKPRQQRRNRRATSQQASHVQQEQPRAPWRSPAGPLQQSCDSIVTLASSRRRPISPPFQQQQQQQQHASIQQLQHALTSQQAPAPSTTLDLWLASSSSSSRRGSHVGQLRGRLADEVAGSGLAVAPQEAFPGAIPAPPPVAPRDPAELLQVVQTMPPPRRRLVIFKAGGYVYSDMEALLHQSGLARVARLTNLIRKAGCVLAKQRWDNGRVVDLRQHRAAAAAARVPFLLLGRLEAAELAALLRPLLLRKGILAEAPGTPRVSAARANGAAAAGQELQRKAG